MTKKLIILFLFLSVFPVLQIISARQSPAPTSRIIDAKQLLRDTEILSADDMQGRRVGTPGNQKAREYVVRRFKETGLTAFNDTFLQTFDFSSRQSEKIQGANVVGYIKGKKTPEKYIVITAHYDHVGVRSNEIYNGADDNASGTSALFALVKYFNKNRPANSIIFAALDAEEGGLQGAKKFVATPPVKKEAILLNVNMDMISRSDTNELYAMGTYHYPFLKKYLDEVVKTAPVKLLLGHDRPEQGENDWTSQSDHAAFHQAQIPFVYFGVEDHKDYHRPTDDFVNINQTFYVHAVETILEAVKKFDANLAQIEKQRKATVKN